MGDGGSGSGSRGSVGGNCTFSNKRHDHHHWHVRVYHVRACYTRGMILVVVALPSQTSDTIIITGKTKSKSFFHGPQRGGGQALTGTRASVA